MRTLTAKQQRIYDFPQKQKKRIWQMRLVGSLLAIPSIQKKAKGQMTAAMVAPYQKVLETVRGQKPQDQTSD